MCCDILSAALNDVNIWKFIFTARKRSLGQGNIFTPVCHSVHRGGWHVWLLGGQGVRGCSGGACMVAWGGHVWLLGGACVVARGACVVAPGGHAWLLWGGHAWLLRGGMHGCSGGACVVFFSFFRYNEIRSMSGRYASYWNAFLFKCFFFIYFSLKRLAVCLPYTYLLHEK